MRVNRLENLIEFLATDTSKFYGELQLLVQTEMSYLNISAEELADVMGCSTSTVYRILRGPTSGMEVGTFFRLLHALDYDLPIEKAAQSNELHRQD